MLQGLITAIVTPMHNDGSIDFESLTGLLNYQMENGANAFVVLGSTGEAATLNQDEKLAVINHVVEVTKRQIPLIVGVSQAGTRDAVAWLTLLNQIDEVDYVLALTPAYVKATQAGMYAHFEALANATPKGIIIYNVPGRTGCNLHDDTTLKLAHEFKNIIGLKDATGDIARTSYLVKHRRADFALYSGDDATTLAFTLVGGDGAISVTGNVAPAKMSRMIHAALNGDKSTAIKLNSELSELHSRLFCESNPIPVKWALSCLGIISSPSLRLPLQPLNSSYRNMLLKAVEAAF